MQVFSTFWPANVLRATAACNFLTSNLQKVVRTRQFFNIFTRKCASRHSGVQFLNIATSKMAPPMWCFVHFDLQMCFSPQPRGILEHRNFQNVSGAEVFSTFWRANVLRATAACHFSPVRETATSAPAALAKLLFEHQEPRLIEKTQRFATSLTFGAHVELLATDSTRMLIFVLLTLHACWSSCYWLYTHVDLLATDSTRMLIFLLLTWLLCDSAFQLCILSEVRLLNFLRLSIQHGNFWDSIW